MNTITLSKNYTLREYNGYVELRDDQGQFIRTLNSFEEEFVKAAYAEGQRSLMVDYRAIIEPERTMVADIKAQYELTMERSKHRTLTAEERPRWSEVGFLLMVIEGYTRHSARTST